MKEAVICILYSWPVCVCVCPGLQRFSMEGLSNILQTGIRQTFGSTGNEKQVRSKVKHYSSSCYMMKTLDN